ncbi:MAG: hypothetical protein Q8K60_00265, partial [Parachlamydiaceae bacterium]|nr:hypothetical protein [Parachlamydiaceae bacterium]
HSISQDLFESQMAKIKPGCVVDGGNSLRFIILAFFIYRINKTRTFSKTNLILGCLSSINVISQIFLGIKPLKFIEALKNTEGLPYFKSRCFHYYFGISDLDGGVLKTDDIKDIEIIENDLSNVINNAAIQWIKTLELIYELQSHLPDSLKLKFFNHLKNKEIKEVLSTLQKAKKITKNYTKIEFYKNWEKRFLQQQEIYSYMNTILFHCHHITVPLQLKSDLEINKEYNKICINVAESYKPFFEIPKEEDLIKVKESIDALDQYDIFKNNSMFIKVKDLVSKLYVDEISDY